MHLLPLPHAAGRTTAASSVDEGANRAHPTRNLQPKKKAKASSKAKANCPDELKGYKQFDDNNQPICWAFNMSKGCQEETKNGRCKKGSHVCIKCKRSNHSLGDVPRKKTPDSRVTKGCHRFHAVQSISDANKSLWVQGQKFFQEALSQVMKSLTTETQLKTSRTKPNQTANQFHPSKTGAPKSLTGPLRAEIFLGSHWIASW